MLGIVGGVGPESTADYYRRLIDGWRERGPVDTYPSILLVRTGKAYLGRSRSSPAVMAPR